MGIETGLWASDHVEEDVPRNPAKPGNSSRKAPVGVPREPHDAEKGKLEACRVVAERFTDVPKSCLAEFAPGDIRPW